MAFLSFLHIFTDLFNASERAWHKLDPAVQNAMVHGSGIVKIISDDLDKVPDEVFEAISEKYPDITKENLHSWINSVNEFFGLQLSTDFTTALKTLQDYLASKQGNFWDSIRSIVAQVISFAAAPEQTGSGIISSLIEWVFRKKVK